jgi:hypothetical protein
MSETVFQKVSREYDEWTGTGSQGRPPARLAFGHPDVRVWVDPFRKLPGTVVVVPREGTPGKDAYLHDLPAHRLDQMSRVRVAFGRKMLAITGVRPIEHVEGYGVPDHAHVVMFPAARGEGRALYESVERPGAEELEAELDTTLALYGMRGEEAAGLRQRLTVLASMAILLDAPRLPQGTTEAVASLTDRALLAT